MEKLHKLDVTRLHHAEFGQLMVRFFEDFTNVNLNAAADPDFKRLYDGLLAQVAIFNSGLNQIKASEESQEIARLDVERDNALQNLRNSLKPYRNSSEAEAEGYNALSLLLSEYKDTHDASFESETNQLNTLSNRLGSSDFSNHVAELGIGKFVIRMIDANTAFNNLFSQRSFKTSQKEVLDVKALRKVFAADYKKMTAYISAMASVKDDVYYKNVLDIINNGRLYFSNIVLARRAGKKLPPTKTE
ncbi:DUF6261 family protein [Chryseobacterium foetidum]|uniref:DUF6261 family protein n=1 Tax=Chryseobacterium foetidum TaxID=2951057 RepID=UPI0021C9AF4C|nr:DUF6261 family protein [Chryseobacterium foetidum]